MWSISKMPEGPRASVKRSRPKPRCARSPWMDVPDTALLRRGFHTHVKALLRRRPSGLTLVEDLDIDIVHAGSVGAVDLVAGARDGERDLRQIGFGVEREGRIAL